MPLSRLTSSESLRNRKKNNHNIETETRRDSKLKLSNQCVNILMYWNLNLILAPSSNHYINCIELKRLKLAIKPTTAAVTEMCGVLACICPAASKNTAVFSHQFALEKK